MLSKYFSLKELCVSNTANRLGLNNIPAVGSQARKNLEMTAKKADIIRDALGSALLVSSGYRAPAVNKAVGGVSNSAHVKGFAVDISSPEISDIELFKLCQKLKGKLNYDQLILEYPERGASAWVHIGFVEEDRKPRGQEFVISRVNKSLNYWLKNQQGIFKRMVFN